MFPMLTKVTHIAFSKQKMFSRQAVFMGLFFAMQFHLLNQHPIPVFQEHAFSHIIVGTIWFLVNQQISLWKEPMMEFYSVLIWSLMTIRSCLDVLVVWMGWSVAAGQQNSGWLANFLCVLVSCMMFYMVITLEEEDGRHE